MTIIQNAPPEALNGRSKESINAELERLLRELTRINESQLGTEIEKSIAERVDAYQQAVIRSVEVLCANALVNSRDIERLNRVIASLPEPKSENGDLRRVLANIERFSNDTGLSRREIGVLTQLLQGKSNREIAKALDISDKTVKNHLWKIYRKLGVGNRSQLFHKLMA